MWKGSLRSLALAAASALLASAATAPLGAQAANDQALVTRARAIHDRVIALDTHVDINPANFTIHLS